VRPGWRSALGIALSVGLLWWVLRDQDVGELFAMMRSSNVPLWLGCTLFATLIFPLRARRWQALLAPTYGRLPLRYLWQSTAIGMMVNNVVPLRAGEFARAFVLTRVEPRVRFAAAFGSLAVDRLFDGTIVLLLMLAATLDPSFPGDRLINGTPLGSLLQPAAAFLGVVLAGALMLLFAPAFTARMIDGVVGRVAPRLAPKVHHVLGGFVEGLGVLRKPALMAEVVFWTLLHWLCNAFAFWLGLMALGITIPFSATFLVQGVIVIGVAAPGAPGFFGAFEFAATVGLALYSVGQTEAVAWALGFHFLSYIPITVIGAWYLTQLRIRFADFRGKGTDTLAARPTPEAD